MRICLRWIAAVALGVAVFEGVDLWASASSGGGLSGILASLSTISPAIAGAVAAGAVGCSVIPALLAAVAVAWARIGVDLAIGMTHGVRPTAEAETVLLLAFGVPWTVMAFVGGGVVGVARRLRRWRAPAA